MYRRLAALTALVAAGCSFDGGVPVGVGGSDSDSDILPNPIDASAIDAPDSDPAAPDGTPPTPAYSLAVNLAGVAHVGTDYPGNYLADDGSYCGGSVYVTAAAIHNTVDDPLFQSNRYGTFTCDFGEDSLANGEYTVTLLMGEVYRGTGCPSSGTLTRIYDVSIEGTTVLSNFDVIAESGGCLISTTSSTPTPTVRSFITNVSDGSLTIGVSGATNGLISAIHIESTALIN